jgi:hypothetical protein
MRTARALVAQLAADEVLVTGVDASVSFHVPRRLLGSRMQTLSAEERTYENGTWKPCGSGTVKKPTVGYSSRKATIRRCEYGCLGS